MATPVRFAIPGTYLITRRTAFRKLLMRPDAVINALILFILGLAAIKYGIIISAYSFLSNHAHLIVTDPVGQKLARFNQYFFSLTARAINCYRGRNENLWNCDKPSCVFIPPLAVDLADKIAYTICNAVLSELVDRMNRWPGVTVTADQVGRLTISVERPNFFFSKRGKIPPVITYTLALPPCQDATPAELEALIRKRCLELEAEKRAEMVDQGRPFLGAAKVLTADPESSPTTPDPLFELEPHIACKDKPTRIALLQRLKHFRHEYQIALTQYRAGHRNVEFPYGTLKMAIELNCRCRGPDPNPTLGTLAL